MDDLLKKEQRLFNEEYSRYYIKGETKPKSVGEPFLLYNPGSTKGILLVHGLMAAPEEVREWADFLFSKGYTVYAPRLAGHGTSAVDLSERSFMDWVASVDRGQAILNACCSSIIIGGFSTGAGLALYQAVNNPYVFDAVVSISAPLKFKPLSIHGVELLHAWNGFANRLGVKGIQKPFARNHPDNPHINYHRCPIKGLVEVKALMRNVYKNLPSLKIPALIIQGKNDPKVHGLSGRVLFQRIPHPQKEYKEIDFHQHGIVRGDIARDVFKAVEQFLNTLL